MMMSTEMKTTIMKKKNEENKYNENDSSNENDPNSDEDIDNDWEVMYLLVSYAQFIHGLYDLLLLYVLSCVHVTHQFCIILCVRAYKTVLPYYDIF